MTLSRNTGAGKLSRSPAAADDVNPLDSLTNIADVMLVLVVGLLLALITYWNVDIAGIGGEAVSVEQGQEIAGMEGISGDGEPDSDASKYEEYGKVFRDPETGKLYMVTEGE